VFTFPYNVIYQAVVYIDERIISLDERVPHHDEYEYMSYLRDMGILAFWSSISLYFRRSSTKLTSSESIMIIKVIEKLLKDENVERI